MIPCGGASKASDQAPCGRFLFYSKPSLMQAMFGLLIKQKTRSNCCGSDLMPLAEKEGAERQKQPGGLF